MSPMTNAATAGAAADGPGRGLPMDLSSLPVGKAIEPHPTGQWAMVLLIVTEASLFAYLLFAYFYLAARSTTPWPPEGAPPLGIALPNTAILIGSSVVLLWGERGMRQGDMRRLRLGLVGTIVLGMIFLSLQGYEYARSTFTPATDAYGSAFFTITGLHGAHVLVGILVLAAVLAMALRGTLDAKHHHYVSNGAMYWHFVDAVWLAVLSALYLAPRVSR